MSPQTIAEELKNIPAGYLPQPLFNQIARLGVLSYLELVAYRIKNNTVEVILTKRGLDDPFWPGMYHNPGTVLRPTDANYTFKDPLNRLYEDEYCLNHTPKGPYFAGFYFEGLERGTGLGIISWTEITDCKVGEYYPVDSLPNNIIEGQKAYIKKCAELYLDCKNNNTKQVQIEDLIFS